MEPYYGHCIQCNEWVYPYDGGADGAIMEAARIRCQLDELNKIARAGGLVKYDPANPSRQKTQPVARTITQVRASYISYIAKLTKMLGGGALEEDDDEFDDYE